MIFTAPVRREYLIADTPKLVIDDPRLILLEPNVLRSLLMSRECEALAPAKSDKNFGLPFHAYAINSSHNTYLDKHQLIGTSSMKALAHALEMGARCLELDLWEPFFKSRSEIVVCHGWALTGSLKFRDVLNFLRENAFLKNSLPIILSLELHCDPDYVASDLLEILGDLLYCLPPDSAYLPSPDALRPKFLIKANSRLAAGSKLFPLTVFRGEKITSRNVVLSDEARAVSSLDESKFRRFLSNFKKKLVSLRDSTCRLFRVYPKALRIGSSNFLPHEFWRHGVNLVALNLQTCDDAVLINQARFFASNSGYYPFPQTKSPAQTIRIMFYPIYFLCNVEHGFFLEIRLYCSSKDSQVNQTTQTLKKLPSCLSYHITDVDNTFLILHVWKKGILAKKIGSLAVPLNRLKGGLSRLDLMDVDLRRPSSQFLVAFISGLL